MFEEMFSNIIKVSAQIAAFNQIVNAVEGKSDKKLFFLDGPAGSGKTYLYNTVILYLQLHNYSVLAHATTGIASDLLI